MARHRNIRNLDFDEDDYDDEDYLGRSYDDPCLSPTSEGFVYRRDGNQLGSYLAPAPTSGVSAGAVTRGGPAPAAPPVVQPNGKQREARDAPLTDEERALLFSVRDHVYSIFGEEYLDDEIDDAALRAGFDPERTVALLLEGKGSASSVSRDNRNLHLPGNTASAIPRSTAPTAPAAPLLPLASLGSLGAHPAPSLSNAQPPPMGSLASLAALPTKAAPPVRAPDSAAMTAPYGSLSALAQLASAPTSAVPRAAPAGGLGAIAGLGSLGSLASLVPRAPQSSPSAPAVPSVAGGLLPRDALGRASSTSHHRDGATGKSDGPVAGNSSGARAVAVAVAGAAGAGAVGAGAVEAGAVGKESANAQCAPHPSMFAVCMCLGEGSCDTAAASLRRLPFDGPSLLFSAGGTFADSFSGPSPDDIVLAHRGNALGFSAAPEAKKSEDVPKRLDKEIASLNLKSDVRRDATKAAAGATSRTHTATQPQTQNPTHTQTQPQSRDRSQPQTPATRTPVELQSPCLSPKSVRRANAATADVIAEYKKARVAGKDAMNLIVIGHVDAGKSTLMGHLLFKLGEVNQRTMHKFESESKKAGKSSFAYAWVLDETAEERSRGITMEVSVTKFETSCKKIVLLDAPGHRDFIPSMISGAAQADVGILVVDASPGGFEAGFESGGQTREHAILARSLGVNQLIVAVNKLDVVGWSRERFDDISSRMRQFLKQAGYKEEALSFVPCSGLSGENLVSRTEARLSAWYTGPSIVEQIDRFAPVERPVEKALRLSVADVFKGSSGGITVGGKIESGVLQVGDRVLVAPSGELAAVKAIEAHDTAVPWAVAGDNVNVSIAGIEPAHVSVGNVLCDPSFPIRSTVKIVARIIVFDISVPITPGFPVLFHFQSVNEPANISKLVSLLNRSTGEVVKERPRCISKNSSAIVEVTTQRPVSVDLYRDSKEMGRFMLRSGDKTIAAGVITEL